MKENFTVPRRGNKKSVKFITNKIAQDSTKKCSKCYKKICSQPNCTYIQPPRQKSLKPIQENHLSEVPFSGDTVYRKSYYGVSRADLENCRPNFTKPKGEIGRPKGKFAHESVFMMSFQPHRFLSRRKAFVPKQRSIASSAPFEGFTTHMHDFVPKTVVCRAEKVIRGGTLKPLQGKFSGETVNRLSYSEPIGAERVMSLKPKIDYRPPTVRMDTQTVHRLSYQPTLLLPQREIYPWMKKNKHTPCDVAMEKDTIYRRSYFANANFRPPKPIRPSHGGEAFPMGGKFNPNSTYKMSYYPQKILRVPPMVHKGEIVLDRKPFDGSTVHKLSYSEPLIDARRQPLKPIQRRMLSNDPMEGTTTHMRDFIPQMIKREPPCRPKSSELSVRNIQGTLSSDTVHRLSFVRPDLLEYGRVKSCKPPMKEFTSNAPFDGRTINKLSFQPPPADFQRETPAGVKKTAPKSVEKMSGDTIHSLSYAPPGQIINDDSCCCCSVTTSGDPCNPNGYPKAGL